MKTDEFSVHLFLRCPFVLELWSWIGGKLSYMLDLVYVVSLMAFVPTHCSSQAADICVYVVVHTLHIIWLSCNSMRFSSDVVYLHVVKVRLQIAVLLSGNLSVGHCLLSDVLLLDAFSVVPHHRRFKDIIIVHWKAPSPPWMKVNTNGSIVGNYAGCGGLFRDHLGTFLGVFTCNLGIASVFSSEIQRFVFALEFAAQNGWNNLWLESDSTNALLAFKNPSLVLISLRNRWHNACHLGVQVRSYPIFTEKVTFVLTCWLIWDMRF